MKVACIIPARGGSKGIPGKNIKNLAGKPLIAWSIERALESKFINGHVYVSSDSDKILNVSEKFGARPIKRPAEIALDTSPSEEAILHAISTIGEQLGHDLDLIVFLQPTSPFRKKDDIDNAVRKLLDEKADSLLSVRTLEDFFLWKENPETGFESINFDYKNRRRRQDLSHTFLENGSIYVFKPDLIERENNRLGGKITVYQMDMFHSFQIDSIEDFEFCEHLATRSVD